ncbi:MAG: hypothetical protein LBJ83_02880 [Oscillospiraceae bacterium]|jgi:hypothetical protein|nr:hypothetical protein [Oscillospiraceae bacterium]
MKIVNKGKFCVSIIIAVGMLFTGCKQSEPYVASFKLPNGETQKISVGLYKALLGQAFYTVLSKIDPAKNPWAEGYPDPKSCWNEKVDGGETLEEKVQAETEKAVFLHVGVECSFAKDGLKLSEEAQKQNQNLEDYIKTLENMPAKEGEDKKERENMLEYYRNSMIMINNSQKVVALFEKATEGIAEDQIKNSFNENFSKFWIQVFAYDDNVGDEVAEKVDAKASENVVPKPDSKNTAKKKAEDFLVNVQKYGDEFVEVLLVEQKKLEADLEKKKKEQEAEAKKAAKSESKKKTEAVDAAESGSKKKTEAPVITDEKRKEYLAQSNVVITEKEKLETNIFTAEGMKLFKEAEISGQSMVIPAKSAFLVVKVEKKTPEDAKKFKPAVLQKLKGDEFKEELIAVGKAEIKWNKSTLAKNKPSIVLPPEEKIENHEEVEKKEARKEEVSEKS